jgi:hypothetical protein
MPKYAFQISFITASALLLQSCGGGEEAMLKEPVSAHAKCLVRNNDGSCATYRPSLVELIVRPEWYDGRKVSVMGVLSFRTEDQALYVSTEDLQHMNTGASVWVDVENPCSDCRDLDGRWVVVVGVFRADVDASDTRGGVLRGSIGRHDITHEGPPRPVQPPR